MSDNNQFVGLYVNKEFKEALRQLAEDEGMSISSLIRKRLMIRTALETRSTAELRAALDMEYDLMPIEVFGNALLAEDDLDPVYNALHRSSMGSNQLRRWLVAYWCFYNAGVSSYISEQSGADFWRYMHDAAENAIPTPCDFVSRWPRGRERRHFRGKKCVEAVEFLAAKFPTPENMVVSVEQRGAYSRIRERVMEWPLFGPWIAFKVGDMLERVLGVEVDFTDSDVFFFDSPRDAAKRWYAGQDPCGATTASPKRMIGQAVEHLQTKLGGRLAPPNYNRPLGIQEFETILCKWGSHLNGHYPIGIDTRELNEALKLWAPHSSIAAGMIR